MLRNHRGEEVVEGNPHTGTYTGIAGEEHTCMNCQKTIAVGEQFSEDLVIVCMPCAEEFAKRLEARLQACLTSLEEKGLLHYLTPEERRQWVEDVAPGRSHDEVISIASKRHSEDVSDDPTLAEPRERDWDDVSELRGEDS